MDQITVNGKKIELFSKSIKDLITQLQLDEKSVAIVKNGRIVKKEDWNKENLRSGDSIEMFSPVSGG